MAPERNPFIKDLLEKQPIFLLGSQWMSPPREEGTSDGPVECGALWNDNGDMHEVLKEFYDSSVLRNASGNDDILAGKSVDQGKHALNHRKVYPSTDPGNWDSLDDIADHLGFSEDGAGGIKVDGLIILFP